MSAETKVRHTPGPWAWDNTPNGARLMAQHSGRLVVMDCARKGMRDAEPRFSDRNGERRGGVMHPASNLDLYEHPDARLIAAAPELLEAARTLLDGYVSEDFTGEDGKELPLDDLWVDPSYFAAYHALRAAIAKAEG